MNRERALGAAKQIALTAPLWAYGALWSRLVTPARRPVPPRPIEERTLRPEELASLADAREPVVVRGLLRAFTIYPWMRPEVIADVWGDRDIITYQNDLSDLAFQQETATTVPMRYRDFIQHCFVAPRGPVRLYTRHGAHREALLPDVKRLRGPGPFSHVGLWVGQRGNVTPLHFDEWFGFLGQFHGAKQVIAFPPEEIFWLDPSPFFSRAYNQSYQTRLPVNCLETDVRAHPRFPLARRYETVLQPGDLLFIPPTWWHNVISLEDSISLVLRYDCPRRLLRTRGGVRNPWGELLEELGVSRPKLRNSGYARPWGDSFDYEDFARRAADSSARHPDSRACGATEAPTASPPATTTRTAPSAS